MLIYRCVPYKADNKNRLQIFYEGINLKEKGILVPFKGKFLPPRKYIWQYNSFIQDNNIYKYFYPSLVDAIIWGRQYIEDSNKTNGYFENLIMAFDIPNDIIKNNIGFGNYVFLNKVEVRLPLQTLYELYNQNHNPLWYECLKFYQYITNWNNISNDKNFHALVKRCHDLEKKDLIWAHDIILTEYLAFEITKQYYLFSFSNYSDYYNELIKKTMETKKHRSRKLMEEVNKLKVSNFAKENKDYLNQEVLPVIEEENQKLVRSLKKEGIYFTKH